MKVQNIISDQGNIIPNQFIITHDETKPYFKRKVTFQSYESTICEIDFETHIVRIGRDWNYSPTTFKYFRKFITTSDGCSCLVSLNNRKAIQKAIDDGKHAFWKIVFIDKQNF